MARHEIVGRGQQVGLVIASGVVPDHLHPVAVGALVEGPGAHHRAGHRHPLPAHRDRAGRHRRSRARRCRPCCRSPSPGPPSSASAPPRCCSTSPSSRWASGSWHSSGYRDHEPTVRALVRQAGWRFGLTGVGATVLAAALAAQHRLDVRLGAEGRIERFPIAIPVGLATSAVIERIRQRDTPPEHLADPARSNPLLGLAAGAGVVAHPQRADHRREPARPRARLGGEPGPARIGGHLASRRSRGRARRRGPRHARRCGPGRCAASRPGTSQFDEGHGRVRARAVDRPDRRAATRRAWWPGRRWDARAAATS